MYKQIIANAEVGMYQYGSISVRLD